MGLLPAVSELEPQDIGNETIGSNVHLHLNEFDEDAGISLETKILLSGSDLREEQKICQELFGFDDSKVFAYFRFKARSNAQDSLDRLKQFLENVGSPHEMAAQFATLHWKADDQYVYVAVEPQEEMVMMALAQVPKLDWIRGDGSKDQFIMFKLALATDIQKLLDESPAYTHLLEGISIKQETQIMRGLKDIVQNLFSTATEQLQPIFRKFGPLVLFVLLFKQLNVTLDLEATQEMQDSLKQLIDEKLPMANSPLAPMLEMVKHGGMIPMQQEIVSFASENIAGEFQVYLNSPYAGIRLTVKLPQLSALLDFLANP